MKKTDKKTTEISNKSFANSLKTQDMTMLITLSKEKTILQSAISMNLSQPAITKRLQDLEKSLGVVLFQRMSRGVEPTPFGEILIKHSHILLNQIRQAEDEVSDLFKGKGGRVNIGIPSGAAAALASKSIAEILKIRKNIKINIVEEYNAKLIPLLKCGDIDLIVGRLPEKDQYSDIKLKKLYREKLKVVVRNEHPLANKEKIKTKDLLKWDWIMPLKGTIINSQIQSFFHAKKLSSPRASIYSSSRITNMKILKSADLITAFPQESIQEEIKCKNITELDIDMSKHASFVGIITREDGFLSPAAQMFIEITTKIGKVSKK